MTRDADIPERESSHSRTIWGLIGDPVVGPFFAGKLLSTAGVWVHNTAAAILVYDLTASALAVGAVSVAQFAPQVLLGPFGGALADRHSRRMLLMVGWLTVALGNAGFAFWLAVVGSDGLPGSWPIHLTAVFVGVGVALGGPALQAILPSLVPREELASAVALNSVPNTIARAGGPMIGASTALALGPAAAYGVAAVGSLGFVVVLLGLRLPPGVSASSNQGGDGSVRAGFLYLREDPGLLPMLLAVAAISFGADPAITLTPTMSSELGYGSRLVGVLASSFGVGGGVGFVFLAVIQKHLGLDRSGTAGLLGMGVSCLVLASASAAPLACLGFAIAGAGMTISLTSYSTLYQLRLPEAFRGRVMALWLAAFLGIRPVAAAINGGITDAVSLGAALYFVGATMTLAAWYARPSRL